MSKTDMSAKRALNKKLMGIISVLFGIILIITCFLTMHDRTGSPVNEGTESTESGVEATTGDQEEETAAAVDTTAAEETSLSEESHSEMSTDSELTDVHTSEEAPHTSVSRAADESEEVISSTVPPAEESSPVEEPAHNDAESSEAETEPTKAPSTTEASTSTEETKPTSSEKPTQAPTQETEQTPSTTPEEEKVTIAEVTVTPKKSSYTYGYKLSKSDLTVKVSYSDGTTKTITNGFTITQNGHYVYVTYEGKRSDSVRIYFEDPAVKSVSITATTEEYAHGYQLAEGDLNVTVTYEDNTKTSISDGFTIHQTGTKIYVVYDGVKSNTITISYTEAATEPARPTIKSVTVSARASVYPDGYKLTSGDLLVKAAYSDGTSKTVTTGYTISQAGKTVYVTYDGVRSNTLTIAYQEPETQAPVLDYIQISAKASEYESGYQLTTNDLTVKAYYSDGSNKNITGGYTIKQSGASFYVVYEGVASNTITITYQAVKVTSVSISAKASEYDEGYQLNTSDLTVMVGYSDGTSMQISSEYSIIQNGTSVYVTYQGVTSNTIAITYKQPAPIVLTSISASTKQGSYEMMSTITAADFNVTAHYSDGSSAAISDGVSLLYAFDSEEDPFEAVGSLQLAEYVNAYGNTYYMGTSGAYVVRVSYQGVQSGDIQIGTHYTYSRRLCTEMLDLVNQARASAGLHALSWDSNAENAVYTRVDELLVYYSHSRPNGGQLTDLYQYAGLENINHAGGIDMTNGVNTCFTSWMNSAGHRAAILSDNPSYTGFACAEIRDPGNGTYWVMILTRSAN